MQNDTLGPCGTNFCRFQLGLRHTAKRANLNLIMSRIRAWKLDFSSRFSALCFYLQCVEGARALVARKGALVTAQPTCCCNGFTAAAAMGQVQTDDVRYQAFISRQALGRLVVTMVIPTSSRITL